MSGVHLSVVLGTIDQDLCRPGRISALKDHTRQLCACVRIHSLEKPAVTLRCGAVEQERAHLFLFLLCKEPYWDAHGLSYHVMLVV